MIFTREFWKAAAERAIRAAAWSLLSALGAGVVNILEVPWLSALGVAAGAGVLSLLASIAVQELTGSGPSLTDAERLKR